MRKWDKTISFVSQKGNSLDQLRLRRARGESYLPNEVEDVLASYQFPDGSWDYDPSGERSERIGSLGGTIHCLRWLREFGLGNSSQMAHTLEFLAAIQDLDGSFYETEAKLAHSPHKWLRENTLIDRFYFTAAVPLRLFSLGHTKHPINEPALEWLERHEEDWELVTGTWYNLWALLCLLDRNDVLYSRCYAKALEWLPRLDSQPLTWLLDALQGAGFSMDEPLVTEGIVRLKSVQNEEGIWVDSEYSTVETTITALRILQDYRIGQEG